MDIDFSGWKKPRKDHDLEIPGFPLKTPKATVEHLLSLCINDENQEFEETLDRLLLSNTSPSSQQQQPFDVQELGVVMEEAVHRGNVRVASKLLSSGYPIHCSFALQATFLKAKGILECYIQAGWDINEPLDDLRPPVLA